MRRVLVIVSLLATAAAGAAAADPYPAHVKALRARLVALGLGGLHVRVEQPFVLAGDGDAALAQGARIVRWATTRLEHDFFDHRPARVLDVFLFEDPDAYQRGARLLSKDPPDTPYGFYASDSDALIMNLATGGGTLVHELVHPYVEADFPDAPPWLNEGLGSLFEQSDERDGHIIGRTNWRLAGLQQALADGDVPSFDVLTAMDDAAFYDDDRGVHYAEARYLLYWLQERGLLREFYRAFRAARDRDPTGYATLSRLLGVDRADDVRADWERFVGTLRFPG